MKRCRLVIEQNVSGEWLWRFFAGNGEQTARSSETHPDQRDAIRSAALTCSIPIALQHNGALYERSHLGLPDIQVVIDPC